MAEIDLHTHSTFSDGTLTPAELVLEAKKNGLKAIALTDHDTTKGLAEGIKAGQEHGLEFIPGCELSVDYPQGHMHILGLWLPEHPRILDEKLVYLRDRRHSRNERILGKLMALGLKVKYEEVKSLSGGESVGRPHIAALLRDKGYVGSISEAFDKYIGPGGQAYIPKDKLSPEEAIDILTQEQALVTLAHPYSLELTPEQLRMEILRLQKIGLQAVEVIYPDHSRDQTKEYARICNELGLLISGGTDFHGSVKQDITLGKGRGDLIIPYRLLQSMKEYRQSAGHWIT